MHVGTFVARHTGPTVRQQTRGGHTWRSGTRGHARARARTPTHPHARASWVAVPAALPAQLWRGSSLPRLAWPPPPACGRAREGGGAAVGGAARRHTPTRRAQRSAPGTPGRERDVGRCGTGGVPRPAPSLRHARARARAHARTLSQIWSKTTTPSSTFLRVRSISCSSRRAAIAGARLRPRERPEAPAAAGRRGGAQRGGASEARRRRQRAQAGRTLHTVAGSERAPMRGAQAGAGRQAGAHARRPTAHQPHGHRNELMEWRAMPGDFFGFVFNSSAMRGKMSSEAQFTLLSS